MVLFAGTGQEPDKPRGRTVCWWLGFDFDATVLYQPGIGTWETALSRIAQGIGYGASGLADDMIDRMTHYAGYRVYVFGESRGADEGYQFCERYQELTGSPVRLYCALDSVSALGWQAAKRLGPRRWWQRTAKPRPAAECSVHLIAGREPARFYIHDDLDADLCVTFPWLSHGQLIRSQAVRRLCVQLGQHFGLKPNAIEERAVRARAEAVEVGTAA